MHERGGAAVRLAVVATALLGLLALVALASSGGIPWNGARGAAEARSLRTVGQILTSVVLVGSVVVLFAVYVRSLRRAGRRRVVVVRMDDAEPPRRRWVRVLVRLAPWGLAALIVAGVYLAARELDRHFPEAPPADAAAGETGPDSAPGLRAPAGPAGVVLVAAAVGAMAALAAATAVPVVRRRIAAADQDDEARRTRLARVLDASLDDIVAEPDPRRAVVAAYARMEAGFGVQGHGRRPHEAPLEYLARVLGEVRADPAAVAALTRLFERAKFSRHEIVATEKDEAIASLVAIRRGLEAPA